MLDTILQLDREILLFLNSLGTEQWDPFWLFVTKQFNWMPLFLLLLFLLFKNLGLKQGLFTLLFVAILIAFSDQFTNLVKHTFERIRPCNEETLIGFIRDFEYKPGGYSYYSGHAALSSTFSVFFFLLMRKKVKYLFLLFLFPLFFGFSRIYLGVHYPFDVLSGYVAGIFFGSLFFRLYQLLAKKFKFI